MDTSEKLKEENIMSQKLNIMLPVARLVRGSLYEPQTTDAEKNPMTYKSGPRTGEARVIYYFSVAIKKKTEKHWNQTEWGAKIYDVGVKGFPNGQYKNSTFAWKIIDGDSDIPNKAGKKPCDNEGYKGHWVLNLSSGHQSKLTCDRGRKKLDEKDFIKLGYFVQVHISVNSNNSMQQPGLYINHNVVNFVGYGEKIIVGIDPASLPFEENAQIDGMSSTPPDEMFNEEEIETNYNTESIPPYPEILEVPKGRLTAKAMGKTYEQLKESGWSDEDLVKHGMMII